VRHQSSCKRTGQGLCALLILLTLLLAAVGCSVAKRASRTPETDSLFRAVRAGSADSVKALLVSPNVDVNATDEHGNTPLIEAARLGHDDIVRALLIARADPQAKNDDGKTALMLASEGGHDDAVRALSEAGAGK
jgi:ankyrin repeat protein